MKTEAQRLLRSAICDPRADFRSGQWEAIEALVAHRNRVLVVQRTGWGKSIVYFLATRLLRDQGAGSTLLISPLLSLMRNQIQAAQRIGVRAETINSTNIDDWTRVEHDLRAGQIDILLISPERLGNDDFVNECLLPIAGSTGLFVVDEAHCISDWGHDFRPDYRRIVRVLRNLPPNMPMLATTATANDRVVQDIQEQLGPRLTIVRGPLARESLKLENLRISSQAARMAWLADRIPRMPGSGIVYALTVRDTVRLTEWLQSNGIDSAAYYGGLDKNSREALEDRLLANRVKVLVATVALGMGFDKPDLAFVIHFQRPASVIHYYQQVGRAGRALPTAHGILLSGAEDDEIADYFVRTAFPSSEDVQRVSDALRTGRKKESELQSALNISNGKLRQALKFLLLESPAPIQKTGPHYARTPVRWTMPTDRIDRITAIRRREQQRMRDYLESPTCLMQFLSAELNDPEAAPCGKCAPCSGQSFGASVPRALADAASEFLKNLDVPVEPRKRWPTGIDFEGNHGGIPLEFQAQWGRALCRWGDPGFGDTVRRGKQELQGFGDDLVEACVRLVSARWNPHPQPEWLTWAPSRRRPRLVPDFARRLATALGVPAVECIRKVRETEPQKTRQNSHQQVRNLEHAFEVDSALIRRSPVLLFDDMVDSRWTIAILAIKLRQAGTGPVFPLALADSSAEGGN